MARAVSVPPVDEHGPLPRIEHHRPDREAVLFAYELVDLERYEVRVGRRVLGYVEAVPPVFVVYVGATYAQSVEIAQLHDFRAALERLFTASFPTGA